MKTISAKNKFEVRRKKLQDSRQKNPRKLPQEKSQTKRDLRQDPRRPTSTRLRPPIKRKPSKKK